MVKCSLLLCYLEEPSEEEKTAIKEGIRKWARDLQSPSPVQFYTRDGSWWIEAIETLANTIATAIIGWSVKHIADQLFSEKKEIHNKNISLPSGPARLGSSDDIPTETMQVLGQVDQTEFGGLTEERLANIAHILDYLPTRPKPMQITFTLLLDDMGRSVTMIPDDDLGARPVLVAEGKPDQIRRLAIELVAASMQDRDS